eukprot:CAMPEP_0201503086 /NCGR_PEP_ID=MMETSP0151_2-20130828/84478_1 /ASSEMBLY_ACC=CAM_ASM_000257 /TAXON_ID=200890 /ORGANISM="Paramoeba atlantica, Strain 621/1 / CCAP 1560/9" /LENGTH=229 /DNA_ID=CAMNT_0047896717 /DNA_START=1046 /DNA_END=1735 /DNA_ORIENTATION=+
MSSSLSLARATFKNAPVLSSTTSTLSTSPSFVPSVDFQTLSLARHCFQSSAPSISIGPLPSASQILAGLVKGSESIYQYSSNLIRSLLNSIGSAGYRLWETIKNYPKAAAALTGGILVVAVVGLSYKLFFLKDSEFEEVDLLVCPITMAPFVDPVVASDGHTYERAAILLWFQTGHNSSPMTGEPLEHFNLTTNWIVHQTQLQRLLDFSLTPSSPSPSPSPSASPSCMP